MKIENPEHSSVISTCLSDFANQLEKNLSLKVDIHHGKKDIKGEIITGIIIGVVTCGIYDILKTCFISFKESLNKDEFIVIDGKKVRIKKILESEEIKSLFDGNKTKKN